MSELVEREKDREKSTWVVTEGDHLMSSPSFSAGHVTRKHLSINKPAQLAMITHSPGEPATHLRIPCLLSSSSCSLVIVPNEDLYIGLQFTICPAQETRGARLCVAIVVIIDKGVENILSTLAEYNTEKWNKEQIAQQW